VSETYQQLIDVLDSGGARYRIIDHPEAGPTDEASAVRGNQLSHAAKCIVIRVSLGKQARRYVLAVVPGDRRVDLDRVRDLVGGTRAMFASRDIAEQLTGSVSGSITPFSFRPDLELVADPALFEVAELYFNASRLDRSLALASADYHQLARPRIAGITQ
jgi:Ala-tRNA(Pro) deacylase